MKKRKMKSILWTAALVLLVLILVAVPFLMELRAGQSPGKASILSASVEQGDISTSYSGSGTLKAQEACSVSVPDGVKLTEYLVETGAAVAPGEKLALTDRVSVMEAITKVQKTLDTLNDQLKDAAEREADEKLTAQVGGRVMAVYAGQGDDARETMLAHGALAVLSLDGKLAAKFPCDKAVTVGDTVTATISDGSELSARVESLLAGELCVTVSDDAAALGEAVTVKDAAGAILGSGTLYVHSEWRAAAYTGTVKSVKAEVGDTVSDGQTLFSLTDADDDSQFQLLCAKHRVYEELLTELFHLYQDGAVVAKTAGQVTLPEDTEAYLLSAQPQAYALCLLSNAPMGEPEAQYINMVGVVTACNYAALSLNMCPAPLDVADYLSVTVDPATLTEPATAAPDPATPVFSLVDGQWQQGTLGEIAVGDTILFAYTAESNQPVWIVRLAKAQRPDETQPDEPQPDQPTVPETPTIPNIPNMPSVSTPSGYGSAFAQSGLYAAYAGTELEEQTAALYAEAETEILTVTPCEALYIELTVDELDILRAQPEQKANVTIDALPGRSFEAAVTEISAQGVNSGGNSKFTVTLTLPWEENLLPGMNASAVVPLDCHEGILTVPAAALCEQGGKTYVYRTYDKDAGLGGRTEVTTGVSDGALVEITEGLSEHDQIWYEYYDQVEISNEVPQSAQKFFGRGG